MRQLADYWTATKKFQRTLFLLAALLPLAGCPEAKKADCEGSGCEDHDPDSDGTGGYGGGME